MHEKIKEFIQNNLLPLNGSVIKLDDNLFDFGLDSLKIMKLINFLEDEFQLIIPYEKVNPTQLQSINSITNLLEQLSGEVG
jgi:acyl carrier protein